MKNAVHFASEQMMAGSPERLQIYAEKAQEND